MTTPSAHLLKLVAIIGPTASGKSGWAVRLAKRFNGVILSADSRQVYRGLDAITAKVTKQEMEGVPHYLLDVVKVGEEFSVAEYQKLAYKLLEKIKKDNRISNTPLLPIVTGGTGLYVAAVCDGYEFADVEPNPQLRSRFAKLSLSALRKRLLKMDPDTTVDLANPRRIIRALEILASGVKTKPKHNPRFEVLKIGIKRNRDEIKKRIEQRIRNINIGQLLTEAKLIAKSSANRANPLSTYYRPAIAFLSGKLSRAEMLAEMVKADIAYAKRQMTWFRKDPSIHWVASFREAEKQVGLWLNS